MSLKLKVFLGDLVVSIARVAKDNEDNLLGVVGIDIPLEDLAEDFLFSSVHMSSYAFLVTIDGKLFKIIKVKVRIFKFTYSGKL